MKHLIPFVCLIGVLAACRSDAWEVEVERIDAQGVNVESIVASGDSLIAVGWLKQDRGAALLSTDQAASWEMIQPGIFTELYDICRVQDQWFIGLDSVELMVSRDLNTFYRRYWPDTLWVGDLYKHPVKQLDFKNNQFMVVAGGELAFGSIHHWDQTTDSWHVQSFEHELRSLYIDATVQGWRALVGGDGVLLEKDPTAKDWRRLDIKGWFVVGAWWENEVLFVVNHRGEVWSSDDRGAHWSAVHRPPGRPMTISVVESPLGHLLLGTEGRLAIPMEGDWRWVQLPTESSVSAAHVNGDRILAAAGAEMFQFNLAALRE